jgi:hypothetical protein
MLRQALADRLESGDSSPCEDTIKSLGYRFRCRLNRFLERKLAGFNPATKTAAKHADRTVFHRSRKLVTATQAGALGSMLMD